MEIPASVVVVRASCPPWLGACGVADVAMRSVVGREEGGEGCEDAGGDKDASAGFEGDGASLFGPLPAASNTAAVGGRLSAATSASSSSWARVNAPRSPKSSSSSSQPSAPAQQVTHHWCLAPRRERERERESGGWEGKGGGGKGSGNCSMRVRGEWRQTHCHTQGRKEDRESLERKIDNSMGRRNTS